MTMASPFLFRTPVTIRRRTEGRDAQQGIAVTYPADASTVLASVRPLSAKEKMRMGMDMSERATRVRFRSNVSLKDGDRLVYSDKGVSRFVVVNSYGNPMLRGDQFVAEGTDYEGNGT